MNIQRFSMTKKVLCMAALAMLMSAPAFAVPNIDGQFVSGEYTAFRYLDFEVEGYDKDGPQGAQGKGGIYGDDEGEEQGQLWYYQDGTGLYLAFIQPKSLVDNSYGTNAIGWEPKVKKDGSKSPGHTLDNLLGSDSAHIALTPDGGTGFDIRFDYLYTDNKDNPTTWGSGLASNTETLDKYDSKLADGKTAAYKENTPNVQVVTSMQYNWDQGYTDYFGSKDDNPTSPAAKSDYTDSAEPGWIYDNIYEIFVDDSLLAKNYEFGFKDISIGVVHDSPNKIGGNKVWVQPVPEPATMLLLGSGLVGLAVFRRKFRRG